LHDRLAAQGNSTGESKEKRAEESAPLKPVFVHGWVYDLESGTVTDLNVSTGPKGFEGFIPNDILEPKVGEGEATTTKPEEASKTESATESVKETATTTDESAAETSTEAPAEEKVEAVDVPINAKQELVKTAPGPEVKVIGHSTKPTKRSNMLARFRFNSSQQGSTRFSRQI
jgi:hypothetical protein